MKALHFDGKQLNLTEKQKPQLQNGEALIRVSQAGICNTDIEIMKGYMNFTGTLGHEFVGIVEKSSNPSLLNKRVVGEINLACGNCEFCLHGMGNHCPNRTVLGIAGKDGVMAEYVTLPTKNIHIIPSDVVNLDAVFTEPLAAACEINEQMEILPDYRVLVLGAGKMGQLIARVMSLYTDNLLVVGKHPAKLAHLQSYGVRTMELKDFNGSNHGFHVVVEATGSWQGWELALTKVRPKGFLVLKSTYAGKNSFNPALVVINEINVIGSRCGPLSTALHLLRKEVLKPQELITAVVPFTEWEKAFDLAQQPDSLKVVLEF
jgi:threonine dehydrogenase-like Zn-dependent dehydrogenase